MDKPLSLFCDIADASTPQSLLPYDSALEARNIVAIRKHIPSLLMHTKMQTQRYDVVSLASNSLTQRPFLDIVDMHTQQCVYGLDAQAQVTANVAEFLAAPTQLPSNSYSISANANTCVVLGLGMGWQLLPLIASQRYQHIVVYEPTADFFRLSIKYNDWEAIFEEAAQAKVALFLQIGADGASVMDDMQELQQNVSVTGVDVYKHFNTPWFDCIYAYCQQGADLALTLTQIKHAYPNPEAPLWGNLYGLVLDAIPTDEAELAGSSPALQNTWQNKWQKNWQSLQTCYPDIAASLADYQPRYWQAFVCQHENEPQLVVAAPQYGSCYTTLEHAAVYHQAILAQFIQDPVRDSLLTSYAAGKHHHFLHHRMTNAFKALAQDNDAHVPELPDKLSALIVFGLGVGIDLASLYEQHHIEQMMICETELDLFYASLYEQRWADIFRLCDEQRGKCYLTLGDDGQHLVKDVVKQFGKSGTYSLAQTYIFRAYHNCRLASKFLELRETLKTSLVAGEYFDHALYSMAHTQYTIAQNCSWLLTPPAGKQRPAYLDMPVFIVGNGPSLDQSIDMLKAHGDNALIVSCGTSLPALVNYGVVPDFHAEIEINYATYSWLTRHVDRSVLRDMRIVSCNGLHPLTADLFAKVLLACKAGESASHHFLEHHTDIASLHYAYPTVTNFALDYFATAGFHHIYLVGTDFGFIDAEHHHSKASGYYQKDQAVARMSDPNDPNVHLRVPGNFLPEVFTKFEFKVAKGIVEDAQRHHQCDLYNTANGARVNGASPLLGDDVILFDIDKPALLQAFLNHSFHSSQALGLSPDIDTSQLAKQLESMHLTEADVAAQEDMFALVHQLRLRLRDLWLADNKLGYYLLHGTVNNVAANLLKHTHWFSQPEILSEALALWSQFLQQTQAYALADSTLPWDYSAVFPDQMTRRFVNEQVAVRVFAATENDAAAVAELVAATQLTHISATTDWTEADVVIVPSHARGLLKAMQQSPTSKAQVVLLALDDEHERSFLHGGHQHSMPNMIWCGYWEAAQHAYHSRAHNLWAALSLLGSHEQAVLHLIKPREAFEQYNQALQEQCSEDGFIYQTAYTRGFSSQIVSTPACQLPSGIALLRCFEPWQDWDNYVRNIDVLSELRRKN